MLTNELELVLEDSWRKKHTEKKEEGVDRIKIEKKIVSHTIIQSSNLEQSSLDLFRSSFLA